MKKTKYIMASLDIDNELLCSSNYEAISKRTENDEGEDTDYYTVVNELGVKKEYPEYYFDLECK